MTFEEMRDLLIKHFNQMVEGAETLFEVALDKDELWETYLSSFPAGTNEVFRERREHDCSCCRQFIRNFGNVVVIKDDYSIETIWNFETGDETYQPVLKTLDEFVRGKALCDAYVTKNSRVGTEKNIEMLDNGKTLQFDHFYVDVPDRFVDKTRKSEGEIKGNIRVMHDVFKRSLNDINKDSVMIVLELINSNTLYRGEEWKRNLVSFLNYLKAYNRLETEQEKENFAWLHSSKAGVGVSNIKNHSIGVLLTNISNGMDLEEAIGKYDDIVDPTNYKRPKAIYTKRMLDDARKKIEGLEYLESLGRRFATLSDITANNILFLNRETEAISRVREADRIFGSLEKKIANKEKKFDRVEEIGIEKFVRDVLPDVREMEVQIEKKHAGNFVTLIAPENADSKTMFKWNNNFSWAYAGNVTDSMKERVKAAGGRVDGDLRFSIQWNDTGEYDGNDLDAHCIEPDGYEIYYPNAKIYSLSRGMLDTDIIHPTTNSAAVENIIYGDRSRMKDGVYNFFVKCYTSRGGVGGFRAEIEFDGQLYEFDYTSALKNAENVMVAEVTLKDGKFTINPKLKASTSSREIWGLSTNTFVPVTVMMYSPNYWDEQVGNGNRHYFFMLKGCKSNETSNGFYNEFLKNELSQHKKVFEALGSQMRVQPSDDQLSGLGFSSTKRNELVVKVKGNIQRVLKIKF